MCREAFGWNRFVVLSLSVRLLLLEAGHMPCIGEIQMKIVHVKACIDALKAIRDSKHQEISTSIKEELEAVIQELERCCEQSEGDIQITVAQRSRALEILSKVLAAATNLNSLVRAFIDYL